MSKNGAERREFVRVGAELPVRYRFFSQEDELASDELDGVTKNVSAGGILLIAYIPNTDWIAPLLMQKMYLGVRMELEGRGPVRALARVVWVAEMNEEARTCSLGLKFREITKPDQDKLFEFVIGTRMS